ncbi:MAG TPA: GNAT family N-acetyltransferase [Blastocatellia bacterium]|nr:GNAT family N-acetyltransferase [Blastocatellia bacterium]
MDIQIRPATRSDVAPLQELIARSVRALSIGYYSHDQIERSIVAVFGVDTQLVDDGTYFVAEIGYETAGCGGWSRRSTMYGGDQAKSSIDAEIDPRRMPARIRAFFVDPAHARRGVGRSLLEACEDAARRAGFASSELVATLPGVPLYAAFGYVAVEPVSVDLGDGQSLPCVRMTRNLAFA